MMHDPASARPADADADADSDTDTESGAVVRPVFVYGTLRAGGSNDIARYRPAPRFVGKGTVRGTLYDFGGWPGLRLESPAEPGGVVQGEVYLIDPAIEPALDRLEGVREDGDGEYIKRMIVVNVMGRDFRCLVFEIQKDRIAGRPAIPQGDWIEHSADRSCGAT